MHLTIIEMAITNLKELIGAIVLRAIIIVKKTKFVNLLEIIIVRKVVIVIIIIILITTAIRSIIAIAKLIRKNITAGVASIRWLVTTIVEIIVIEYTKYFK